MYIANITIDSDKIENKFDSSIFFTESGEDLYELGKTAYLAIGTAVKRLEVEDDDNVCVRISYEDENGCYVDSDEFYGEIIGGKLLIKDI